MVILYTSRQQVQRVPKQILTCILIVRISTDKAISDVSSYLFKYVYDICIYVCIMYNYFFGHNSKTIIKSLMIVSIIISFIIKTCKE